MTQFNPNLGGSAAPVGQQQKIEQRLATPDEGTSGASQQPSASQLAAQLTQVLSVPGVTDLLENVRQGKKVHVITDEQLQEISKKSSQQQQASPTDDVSQLDFDEMDNRKLFETTSKFTAQTVVEQLQKTLEPLQRELEMLKKGNEQTQFEKIKNEIEIVRSRDPETFDALRPVMMELAQGNNNLSAVDLFNLAKIRKGLPLTTGTQSERPNQTSAKTPKAKVYEKLPTGVGGFRTIMQDALQHVHVEDDGAD